MNNNGVAGIDRGYYTGVYDGQVLEMLRFNALTSKEINRNLGLSLPHSIEVIRQLELSGQVKRVDGKYRLT